MRKWLLPFWFVAAAASAQQTIHSATNGAASNPQTWDCTCFPMPDDEVYIDHQVTMDVDWAVTSGGKIEIASGASLSEDADRQLLIDGAGSSIINKGTITFSDLALTNGSTGSNTGQFIVSNGLYFGSGTTFTNAGGLLGTDSVLTEGNFQNSGTFNVSGYLNTGDFTNVGYVIADSMANAGTFHADANYLLIGTFANFGTFGMSNEGFLDVGGDYLNTGDFTVSSGLQVYVGGNAWNGDTISGSASLQVDGAFVVTGDFGNADDLSGTGDICVGQESMNSGVVSGTLDFCDATGSNFDLQIGTVGANVTFCTDGCHLGAEEPVAAAALLFPNPATTQLEVKSDQHFATAAFYSVTGELVQTVNLQGNTIAPDGLEAGIYFVQLSGETTTQLLKVVME